MGLCYGFLSRSRELVNTAQTKMVPVPSHFYTILTTICLSA